MKRLLTVLVGLLFLQLTSARASNVFANPICEQADPWIMQEGGHYLACFSEGNVAIAVHVSDRLTAIGPKHVVWRAPATGPASREVWAPELHHLDGRWYVYFAASDGRNENHRAWVLQSDGNNPLGHYTLHGPLYTGDDPALVANNRWAIDMTVLELGANRYAIWSGWEDTRDIQNLYIAPLKDPVTMGGPRVQICPNDQYVWERVGEDPAQRGLNEAPETLQHDGRTFVSFSCSGSWQPSYKLGLLELKPGADPMLPSNWTMFPQPVFQSTPRTWGVGHNSFVKSPDGSEDWLVFHAKMDRADGWRRAVFAQRFGWHDDGTPDLGRPVAPGQLLALPSGEVVPEITGIRQYDFSAVSDLADWQYFGHHQLMEVAHGKLRLGGSDEDLINSYRCGEKVVLKGGLWTNVVASVKLRLLNARGIAGLLFRVRDPFLGYNGQSGYFAGISSGGDRVILGSTDGTAWREISSASIPTAKSGEYELRVTACGDRIGIRCNGEEVLRARDDRFTAGSVGLRVHDGDAEFSDLQIAPGPASNND